MGEMNCCKGTQTGAMPSCGAMSVEAMPGCGGKAEAAMPGRGGKAEAAMPGCGGNSETSKNSRKGQASSGLVCEVCSYHPVARTGKGILDYIFEREDIILIAAGSPGCIRSIYNSARERGALSRLIPRIISPTDYAVGRNLTIVKECIETALQAENVSGILLYISCVEFLSGTDYEAVITMCQNPDQIPVRQVLRGPLAKSYGKKITEILGEIPCNGKITKLPEAAPIPYPDFDGVNALAEQWDVNRVLISGSGCVSSVRIGKREGFYYSRFNGLAVTMGIEERLLEGLRKLCQENEKPLLVMESAVPYFISADIKGMVAALRDEGYSVWLAGTNGWRKPELVIEKLMLQLAGDVYIPAVKDHPVNEKLVYVIGLAEKDSESQEKLSLKIRECERLGYQVTSWSPFDGKVAGKYLVASKAGAKAARLMEEKLGIVWEEVL